MHPFFEILQHAGMRQSRMAKLMDVSEGYLARVKSGSKPPSPRFRQRAAAALEYAGIRHPSGRAYLPAELFLDTPPFIQINETNTSVIEVA